MRSVFVKVLLASVSGGISAGNLCQKWEREPNEAGVNARILGESSGISASIEFPNERYYHINDSGSGSAFHVSFTGPPRRDERGKLVGKDSDSDGIRDLESSRVSGVDARDMESMNVGPCPPEPRDARPSGTGCLFLADIGNNEEERNDLRIIIVPEKKSYKDDTKPKLIVNISYLPDSKGQDKHNAESMMVDPRNGDIYIVTKRTSSVAFAKIAIRVSTF
jgi:hypothetical protein